MNWDRFERHVVSHWKKYLIGLLVLVALVWLATIIPWSSHPDDKPTKMVTVATYDHGQKIKVNENIIYAVVFLLFCLFSSFGERKCKCKCKGCK